MSNDIKHFGVLGMKWGRRKARGESSSDYQTYATSRSKETHTMSNTELRNTITRQLLEKQYSDLNPTASAKAKAYVTKLLGNVANELLKQYITNFALTGIKTLGELYSARKAG